MPLPPRLPRYPPPQLLRTRLCAHYRTKTIHAYAAATGIASPLLSLLFPLQARVSAAKDKAQAPVIDVTAHGIFKVLGKGQLPPQPVVVKAKFFSSLAEKKIKEVGGACILTA